MAAIIRGRRRTRRRLGGTRESGVGIYEDGGRARL